jgi:type IV secretory pathway ATPase VirB11/archaellum biosynthesis ATPase
MAAKLTVRLSPEEHRRLKTAATERGLSLQEAFSQMLAEWLRRPGTSSLEDLLSLEGSLAGTDVLEQLEREHKQEIERDA